MCTPPFISSFTENILAAFQDGTTSAEIRYECLRTVKQLLDSNRCFKTIAADTTFCASLVEYLAQPTLLDAPRELAMEVLWQLVEAPTSAETLLPQLMTTEAVTQLHACMQFLLRSSQKAACRQMRNDLVMLLTVLIERHPEITSPSWTALNDELFEVMRSPEQGRTEHGVYSLTHSAEDLEFKKSLLQHFAVIAARSEDVEFKVGRWV